MLMVVSVLSAVRSHSLTVALPKRATVDIVTGRPTENKNYCCELLQKSYCDPLQKSYCDLLQKSYCNLPQKMYCHLLQSYCCKGKP